MTKRGAVADATLNCQAGQVGVDVASVPLLVDVDVADVDARSDAAPA
jgi:hypothetical protein